MITILVTKVIITIQVRIKAIRFASLSQSPLFSPRAFAHNLHIFGAPGETRTPDPLITNQ